MSRHSLIILAFAASSTSAFAAVSTTSTDFGFAAPAGTSLLIDFDDPLPAGLTLTGGLVRNTDDGLGAEPAIAAGVKETSYYLAADPGDPATLTSTTGFDEVSLYWGSIDTYNTLTLLDQAGDAIQSFTGLRIFAPANGDQFSASTNRRVTFTISGATSPIYGLKFQSSEPAFEVDNIAFLSPAPVPEPASWAMMIVGLGLLGATLRRRSRRQVSSFQIGHFTAG